MNGREWKPGDVAMVGPDSLPITFFENGNHDEVMFTNAFGYQYPARSLNPDARPLVVIDFEDRERVERLLAAIPMMGQPTHGEMQAALREFATPTPSKPDEPQGLGAVVEDEDGSIFIRRSPDGDSPWTTIHGTSWSWDGIDPARILSEGVTP